MQIDEGKLRAYLDRSLLPEERAKVEAQLAASADARAILARLEKERYECASYLGMISPPPEEQIEALSAWQRFQSQTVVQSGPSKNRFKERTGDMFGQSFIKRYQPAITILAAVTIIAVALSFAPVRTMAGNLLKVFRVQTVRIVPVDQEDIEALRNNPNLEDLVDHFEAQIKVINDTEPQEVDSVDEAADLVKFDVAEITALPADAGDRSITVYQEKVVQLHLDKDLLAAVFDAAEIEIDLPDSLNEEPIIVTQPDTVVQKWYQEGKELAAFTQMPHPGLEYPDDLDLNALGIAGLQLLGMSEEEAATLGETIDWANTIILPVPSDSNTTVNEVSINGATGLVFSSSGSGEEEAAITWTHQGMSYFIKGQYSVDTVIEMARSVQ